MIGDASQRFHEDPVRLLRAIRMAAKLNFKVEKKTYRALLDLPGLLQHVASARLFDEVGKLFFTGHAESSYEWLLKTGYCEHLFPNMHALVHTSPSPYEKLVQCSMQDTDARFQSGKSLSPGYLFCVLYWPIVQEHIKSELVELQAANKSSLDYLVFITMSTEIASKYYAIERLLVQTCIDVSNANNWNIPFPQMTVHKATLT